MKKIIQSTLLLLAILLPVAITAQPIKADGDNFAQYIKIDGIYYLLFNNGEATVTRNDYGNYFAHAYEGDVVIPPTVNYNGSTYTVTAIGDDAFGYSGQLTSVAIPNTVKSIGKKEFQVCSSLQASIFPAQSLALAIVPSGGVLMRQASTFPPRSPASARGLSQAASALKT